MHSAYNVAFEVPGRSDVPADGADHRVVLRQETLAATVAYRAVPALNPAAFMMARGTAPADYPLLSGPVRLFVGGAYLGSFVLPETAARGELTLPFGVDNRIKVERTVLPQSRESSGKERQVAYSFRTTVEQINLIVVLGGPTQALVDHAKQVVPRCLTRDQRAQYYLDPAPPAWCIEMEKWPYHTQDWKEWLKYKRANANPPWPDTTEWRSWLAARQR